MNWARIAKYTVVYFICSTASGVPLGYVIGRYDAAGEMIPSSIYWSFIFLSMVVEATIIYFLVKNQKKFAFIHALIVVLLSSLIASCILFFLAGEVLLGARLATSCSRLWRALCGVGYEALSRVLGNINLRCSLR